MDDGPWNDFKPEAASAPWEDFSQEGQDAGPWNDFKSEDVADAAVRKFGETLPQPTGGVYDVPLAHDQGESLKQAQHETFQLLKVSPRTMQNALDAAEAYGARLGLNGRFITGPQMEEELAAPDQPVSTLAKVGAGVQAGGINLAEGFVQPEGLALMAAGGAPGLVGRAVNAKFLYDTIRQTPEVYQKLGDALGRQDVAAEAEALFDAVVHGAFAAGTGHGTFKGASRQAVREWAKEFVAKTPAEERAQIYSGDVNLGPGERSQTLDRPKVDLSGVDNLEAALQQADRAAEVEVGEQRSEVGDQGSVQTSGRVADLEAPAAGEIETPPVEVGAEEIGGGETPPADRVESFLDGLKVETGGKGATLEGITGLPVLAWNGSIEVVRAAYRAGKTIVEAAQAGLEWIRKNHPNAKFDEGEYLRAVAEPAIHKVNEGETEVRAETAGEGSENGREDQNVGSVGRDPGEREAGDGNPVAGPDAVSERGVGEQLPLGGDLGPVDDSTGLVPVPGERQFPKQVDQSEDVSSQVKTALPAETRSYEPRSNEADADWARRTIAEQGIPGATSMLKDETNGLPGAQRTALGLALIKKLGEEERAAAAKGDKQAENAAIDAQVDLVDHVAKRSTDIAQSLQAMSMWARLTPAGHLRAARRVFAEAGRRSLQTLKPALDAVREAITEGNAAAADEVTRAPEIRPAVEAETGRAIAESRETHAAVIVEVAGKLGESPEIQRQIRERVRDLVKGDERAAQEQKLKNLLGEHYLEIATKPEAARPLAEKLKAAGVKNPEQLAKAADREVKQRTEAEKAKLAARVKAVRERPLGLLSKETEIDRAIRKQLRQMALRLDTIVKWHYTKADKTGSTLTARLASGLGLSHDGAAFLAARIQQRFTALASARKRALLERMSAGTKARLLTRPGLQQRLIELSNLGAFTEEKYYDAVREKLGLPVWTEEIGREITRRANQIQQLPEGFRQQRGVIDLMNYIQRQKGIKWYELAMPFWYANVLSGPLTHLVNVVSNVYNLGAHTVLEMAKRPASTPQILEAIGRGVMKGGVEAADVMKSGLVTGTRAGKVEAGHGLELKRFTGWATPFNAWKYVARAMAAEDLVFFKAAEEMRAAVAARVIAKKEGITDRAALAMRTSEILGTSDAAKARAEEQARQEGLTGLDYRRRVAEITEQSRPNSMREDAREYGLKVTFNNEPYGLLGVIARGVNSMTREAPVLKMVAPFVNIVANVTNESLAYVPPVGFYRALRGSWSGELDGRPITSREQLFDQYAKAAVGTLALAGVAALAAKHQDEENPSFAVNGAGPASPEQRRQLKETGWIPYSFKIGNQYKSYQQTPLMIPMAILGNYMDALKYKHLDETDLLNRVAYAWQISGGVITEQSFLSGITGVLQSFTEDHTKTGGELMATSAARQASGFVVPNALKQIDQIFDPNVYDARTVQTALINQVPFARRVNQPAINVLGDPVRKFISNRFLSEDRGNELWDVLASKQAWVPAPSRETIVGDKKRGEDYFRTLTPAELYEYTRESGQAIQDRLWAHLDRIRDMEPDQAKKFVDQVTEQEREKAKKQFR